MDIWDLKEALSANKVEDHFAYAIDELGGLRIKGRHLKKRSFLSMLEEHAQWRKENPGLVARYYPNMYHWQVYKLDPDEPAYEISNMFSGMQELAEELSLPKDKNVRYRSRIFTGDSCHVNGKPVPKVFRQYTVEALGVSIEPLPSRWAEAAGTLLPNSLDYEYQPIYFQEKDSRLTVCWRVRVFSCPIEHFAFSLAAPLSPRHPDVLYFEHRWHPQNGVSETFKNVEKARLNNPTLFDRFKTDTFFLLGTRQARGRLPNSGIYPTKEQFLERRANALNHFGGKEPSVEELARFFDISPSTYYRYAELYGTSAKLYAKDNN